MAAQASVFRAFHIDDEDITHVMSDAVCEDAPSGWHYSLAQRALYRTALVEPRNQLAALLCEFADGNLKMRPGVFRKPSPDRKREAKRAWKLVCANYRVPAIPPVGVMRAELHLQDLEQAAFSNGNANGDPMGVPPVRVRAWSRSRTQETFLETITALRNGQTFRANALASALL
ncbi:MAG: hypothetical protein MRY63_01255 [Neomegalonema sp.]|nr:hypothetical protein [Neomegalonema sp.]